MSPYLLQHRHEPHECGVVFVSFKGRESPQPRLAPSDSEVPPKTAPVSA